MARRNTPVTPVPLGLFRAATHPELVARLAEAEKRRVYSSETLDLALGGLSDEALTELRDLAASDDDKASASVSRAATSLLAARGGDDVAISALRYAPDILTTYFRTRATDGWLYMAGPDGHLRPWAIEEVRYCDPSGSGGSPYVTISLLASGLTLRESRDRKGSEGSPSVRTTTVTLHAADVSRRKVSRILNDVGVLVETPELRAEYDKGLDAYAAVLDIGFAEQFRFEGVPTQVDGWRNAGYRASRKVILDQSRPSVPDLAFESTIITEGAEPDEKGVMFGVGTMPVHFDVRVFDLVQRDLIAVSALDLTAYEYDASLREKIVLPDDQRNLLDILTTNLTDFTGDVIEGKSTGNVILCKGAPGVGKTLTAEVYAELIKRPLYSIHSGSLGTSAADVRKNLEVTFEHAARWNVVLLLDEADVFVLERGDNVEQNAIVAEFLRTLEYFPGLLFMTTNRADNIDDAILSRAAAIIDYALPDREGIRGVWKVQAAQQGVELPEDLLEDLVSGFVRISPRDVKMLLRLALRVSLGNGTPLDIDTFARCAMFRGLHYSKGSRPASGQSA